MKSIRQILRENNIILASYRFVLCLYKRFSLKVFFLCDVPIESIPTSTIFTHPYSIIIRNGVQIGENCIIRQNTTIGQRNNDDQNKYAVIGTNVDIGAHVLIIGDVHIGDDVVIGAGSIILKDIPARTKVIGIWN